MRMIAVVGFLTMAATPSGSGELGLRLRVTNPLDAARPMEMVEVKAADLAGIAAPEKLAGLRVTDARTGREVLNQAVDEDGDGTYDRLVFQSDFAPGEGKEFHLEPAAPRKPRFDEYRVYGRFVRERHDDFAWENDEVAFRIYGPALETFEHEPLTSSAVDAWSKRTPRLAMNEWYLEDDYHRDHGDGGDFYPAGKTRGCGGSGLVKDGALAVSKNFRSSRVLAAGPLRLVFEVVYPEWEKPGLTATEVKRVTLDAGSHFNRFESLYTVQGEGPITWAAGIRLAKGVVPRVDKDRGVVSTWEHQGQYGDNGWLGCGLVMDPATVVEAREEAGNQLLVARTPKGQPATWYAGSGWDGSGDFPDKAAWDRHLEAFAARARSPLRVEVLR
jgi:hypothetical protein